MSPNPATDLKSHLAGLFTTALEVVAPEATDTPVVLERPKSAAHGDYACNVAMQLARRLKRNPRELAQRVIEQLPNSPWVERAEIAGAGFINLFLRPEARREVIRSVLAAGDAFGRIGVGGGRKVQVEFVSANPTGPLHVGHGRGAAYGASLANVLLDFAGFQVAREYYVNDAGRQMDILAVSDLAALSRTLRRGRALPAQRLPGRLRARPARPSCGPSTASASAVMPPPCSSASPTPPTATRTPSRSAWTPSSPTREGAARRGLSTTCTRFVLEQLRSRRSATCCRRFGVHFDLWYSERSLYESGRVAQVLEVLDQAGHLYTRTARGGSARRPSATRRTASCSARTACTPTSPPTSPTTSTSSSAASTRSSTSGAPTTTATSRA
jgi:arginyl-tRNA synthetase